ncbi:LCP family protein [Cyanobacterium aponinum UTEX 3221]|uniref:LCP family protein n=1 Tax=Cyanobacterium aponinum TaxID=379064 RepID=UPI002B4BD4CC|nr:LCP family protein [Cyanobacterium aponinum]WRL38954.1 LCP family protein [Cyanobacterium aponinum UTEX 3221]
MSEGKSKRQSNQYQHQNNSKKESSLKFNPRWLFLGFGFSAIAVVSASVGALLALSLSKTPLRQAQLTPAEEAVFNQEETVTFDSLQIPKLSRPVNILVLGIKVLTSDVPEQAHPDLGYHALVNSFEGLSDSMLLLRFDPEKDNVVVLSIPRDTKTLIPQRGVTKINEANALGGPALAAESVSNLLDDVSVDRYIRINIQGVEKLIDALGGLNIYVPEDMKYTDHSQHLYIDLKQGQQHLDGEKAIQFLRFRYDAYGDIGRVQRQQSFMRALVEQTLSPRTILRMPDILNVVRSHLDTNLTTNELIALAAFAAQKNRSDVKMVMLPGDFNTPGEGELSYWLPNHDKISEVMAQHFEVGSNYFSANYQSDSHNLKIAVQSTKDDQEVAQKIVQYLKDNGYSRAYFSYNYYPHNLPETKIIAQQGDNLAAAQLRADLGVGEVVVESTGVINSDVTIQVGSDWSKSHANPANDNDNNKNNFQTISY